MVGAKRGGALRSRSIAPPLVRAIILTIAIASIGSCTTVPYQVRTGTVRTPTLRQMETLNMDRAAPILIRIYKEEGTLEVWKQDRTGRFAVLKSYPICKRRDTAVADAGPASSIGDFAGFEPNERYIVRLKGDMAAKLLFGRCFLETGPSSCA